MNKVILMGRLTRDPDVRYSAGDNSTAVARYALAVDRRFSRREDNGNGQNADFLAALPSERAQSLQKNICTRGRRL